MKTAFRIVKLAKYNTLYRVDKRFLFFWWVPISGSLYMWEAEEFIKEKLERLKVEADNPKDIVIKVVTVERN